MVARSQAERLIREALILAVYAEVHYPFRTAAHLVDQIYGVDGGTGVNVFETADEHHDRLMWGGKE